MASIEQILTITLATLVFANAQNSCVPQTQTESCQCSNPGTTTQKPNLRIEIHERDDPSRPSYPSYPDFPSYPKYPNYPTYRRPDPMPRYIPMYPGLDSPSNYRPMEFINDDRDDEFYMVPVGARRKVIKVPNK